MSAQGCLPGTSAMSEAQDGHRRIYTGWACWLWGRQLQGLVSLYHFRLYTRGRATLGCCRYMTTPRLHLLHLPPALQSSLTEHITKVEFTCLILDQKDGQHPPFLVQLLNTFLFTDRGSQQAQLSGVTVVSRKHCCGSHSRLPKPSYEQGSPHCMVTTTRADLAGNAQHRASGRCHTHVQ